MKLRERKPTVSTASVQLEGLGDVGKSVATVKRGVYLLGTVTAFSLETGEGSNETQGGSVEEHGRWLVHFDDGKDVPYNSQEIR
jgi:hypothetical protein